MSTAPVVTVGEGTGRTGSGRGLSPGRKEGRKEGRKSKNGRMRGVCPRKERGCVGSVPGKEGMGASASRRKSIPGFRRAPGRRGHGATRTRTGPYVTEEQHSHRRPEPLKHGTHFRGEVLAGVQSVNLLHVVFASEFTGGAFEAHVADFTEYFSFWPRAVVFASDGPGDVSIAAGIATI